MRTIISSVIAILLNLTLGAPAIAATESEVPATQFLEAARTIIPQVGPYYSVSGDFECKVISFEVPPYQTEGLCVLTIGNQTAEFNPAPELTSALTEIKPMKGPFYQVTGSFVATSVSQVVPPYTATETIQLILK